VAKWEFVDWLLYWLRDTGSFDFDWDEGNLTKSARKHGVYPSQVEEVFRSGLALPLGKQTAPRASEDRYGLIGPCSDGKIVQVAFTFRSGKVRVISARIDHRKERIEYEKIQSQIPQGI